jgi:predicted alpha/beta-fold hydrolase
MCLDGTENTVLFDSGVIHEVFKPSYLVLSGLAQTLYNGVLNSPIPRYEKELIKLPDGGQLALQSIILSQESKGVVIIVPGICGSGDDHYIVNTVNKAIENGYSTYVINHRGLCDTELLTPLTYHGGSHFDTKVAIDYIQLLHPDKPLYGVSYSLGSNVLTNYLGIEGHNSKLSGAVVVSCPFHSLEASHYSEKSCFGMISRWLAYSSKIALRKHDKIFPQFKIVHDMDVEQIIKNITKFKDFDDKITARMFGYSSAMDYYTKC